MIRGIEIVDQSKCPFRMFAEEREREEGERERREREKGGREREKERERGNIERVLARVRAR